MTTTTTNYSTMLAFGVLSPSKLKPRLMGPTLSSGMMRMFPGWGSALKRPCLRDGTPLSPKVGSCERAAEKGRCVRDRYRCTLLMVNFAKNEPAGTKHAVGHVVVLRPHYGKMTNNIIQHNTSSQDAIDTTTALCGKGEPKCEVTSWNIMNPQASASSCRRLFPIRFRAAINRSMPPRFN